MRFNRSRASSAAALLLVPLIACDVWQAGGLAEPPDGSRSAVQATRNDSKLVTADATALSNAIRDLDNDNEFLVWIKDRDVPPRAAEWFLAIEGPLVIGLPTPAPEQSAREGIHPGPVSPEARQGVVAALAQLGLHPHFGGRALPVLEFRAPSTDLLAVLTLLLKHPNVDYIEPTGLIDVTPSAGAVGSNPTDTKHDMHNIQEAWDYTRGEGTEIGILDSGFPDGHPDGQLLDGSTGMLRLGFVDNYGPCAQEDGGCEPRDDNGHGTHMVGLTAGSDNDEGYVGVAPFALTFSMKIIQNCAVSACTIGDIFDVFGDDDVTQTDDFVAALDFASARGVGVLGMSFSMDRVSSSIQEALYYAYHVYDVLLLSSTGNEAGGGAYPQKYDFVMGVGGLLYDRSSQGIDEYEEVSAYAGGGTTDAACSGFDFCWADGFHMYSSGQGGTSAATAIAAGIAGLVRAYHDSWPNHKVRDRLKKTAHGTHNPLDAHRAIVGNTMFASIDGPSTIAPGRSCYWFADVSGGTFPYTYEWYKDGVLVSTSDTYFGTSQQEFDLYLRVWD